MMPRKGSEFSFEEWRESSYGSLSREKDEMSHAMRGARSKKGRDFELLMERYLHLVERDGRPLFNEVVYHPPNSIEDRQGKDFTVRWVYRGMELVASFGVTLNKARAKKSQKLHPAVQIFLLPIGITVGVVDRLFKKFCRDMEEAYLSTACEEYGVSQDKVALFFVDFTTKISRRKVRQQMLSTRKCIVLLHSNKVVNGELKSISSDSLELLVAGHLVKILRSDCIHAFLVTIFP